MPSPRRTPRRRRAILLSAALAAGSSLVVAHGGPASANPNSTSDVVAYLVEGTGDGHGRGMSQWGAYGWAVDEGWSWEQILDHYYGGTELGSVDVARRISVRLTEWDGSAVFGVISTTSSARWSSPSHSASTAHPAIRIVESAPNSFTISVAAAPQCIGASTLTVPDGPVAYGSTADDEVERIQTFLTAVGFDPRGIDGNFGPLTESAVRAFQIANGLPTDGIWDIDDATAARVIIGNSTSDEGWTEVASGVPGPVVLTTDVGESSAAPGDVLGLCEASGRIVHYRGSLRFLHTDVGNRVVNDVGLEDYLRGVVPREVSPSWGDRGDGRGMNALRAQAVAARGYGLEQSRYVYAQTCDTMACQVYGGSASRANVDAGPQSVEASQTDRAIADTAGRVRVWAAGNAHGIAPGTIASTEFSASNGPQTAGGAFPSIADPADATALNPSHRWTRVISVAALRSAYGGAEPSRVTTVLDPASPYEGIYANRVRLDDGEEIRARWVVSNADPGVTYGQLLDSSV
ncbi:MAG: SpoIID/LytB domain-containing protein, partial [Ilumatobacteraceae bacterium]